MRRLFTLSLAVASVCFAGSTQMTEQHFNDFSKLTQEQIDQFTPEDQQAMARIILLESTQLDKIDQGPNSTDLWRLRGIEEWHWSQGDPLVQMKWLEKNPGIRTLALPLDLPVSHQWENLRHLEIMPSKGEMAPYLEHFDQITHLTLGLIVQWNDGEAFHDALVGHQNLHTLTLKGASAEAFFELIDPRWPLTRIRTLHLDSVWVEDEQVEPILGLIQALPNLETLHMNLALFAAPSALEDFAKELVGVSRLKQVRFDVYDYYKGCPLETIQQILKERF